MEKHKIVVPEGIRYISEVNPETGENSFVECSSGNHKYVVKKMEDEYYKKIINKMISSLSPS